MTASGLNLALVTTAVVVLVVACFLGTTPMGAPRVLAAFLGQAPVGDSLVVWQIRLPRALAAFVVGVALGASGAAMQGLLRNPLAEPGVLGVSASASLGATFVLYYGFVDAWGYTVPVAAITGASAASALIALIAVHTSSVVTLILVGVGLSSFAGAAMSLLMNLAPNPFSLADMVNWMLGSVANRSVDDLVLAAPFMAIGLAILFATRRGLSALTLGEEAAVGVGLNLRRQRLAVVLGTGLATGAAVAIAGAIGFVGIIAPHIVRPRVGHDPARSLLPSALLAGVVLVLADIAVRLSPTSSELKLGVVAAFIGAPVFIWITLQRRAARD